MADSCYITTHEEFCSLSPATLGQAAELEGNKPGQLIAMLTAMSCVIDSQMAQRGDVPFLAPFPHQVRIWLADLVTPRFYEALEFRPTDEIQIRILEREKNASEMIARAGHPRDGLVILPLQRGSAMNQPREEVTFAMSDVDPYAQKWRQHDAVIAARRFNR
jgi:hypothetical protein